MSDGWEEWADPTMEVEVEVEDDMEGVTMKEDSPKRGHVHHHPDRVRSKRAKV